MLILVVVLFLLCWGPRWLIITDYLNFIHFWWLLIEFLLFRFIMETTLKMGVLQFNKTVYWLRVVIFLLPFIHTISKNTIMNHDHSEFYLNVYFLFLVNPLIYVAMSKVFRTQLIKVCFEWISLSMTIFLFRLCARCASPASPSLVHVRRSRTMMGTCPPSVWTLTPGL